MKGITTTTATRIIVCLVLFYFCLDLNDPQKQWLYLFSYHNFIYMLSQQVPLPGFSGFSFWLEMVALAIINPLHDYLMQVVVEITHS